MLAKTNVKTIGQCPPLVSRSCRATPSGNSPVLVSSQTQDTGQYGARSLLDAGSMQTTRQMAGRHTVGGDGGIRTPVQNRWPVASYVRSRHFMCHRGLLP
ncbi:MAG: hypothetical protein K0S14_2951, partial [Thermomicrobiales bacterium]|nr:hypothetical protein [Thermomicrobiales bacterium]